MHSNEVANISALHKVDALDCRLLIITRERARSFKNFGIASLTIRDSR